MKTFYPYLILSLFLFACGSDSSDSEVSDDANEKFYSQDGPKIKAALELKEKLGAIYDSFAEVAVKELEESVCPDSRKLDYQADGDDLDVLLMTNYMLQNFTGDTAAHNYSMPEMNLANGTPLSDFWWLNFNSLVDSDFEMYRDYPDLKDVPRSFIDEDGKLVSYKKEAEDPELMLKACQNSLVGVIAIVDYVPPVHRTDDDFETGYIMGYVLFADWETASVDCMNNFLCINNDSIDFTGSDGVGEGEKTAGTVIMERDLHQVTYESISKIVKKRTRHKGTVHVMHAEHVEQYRID